MPITRKDFEATLDSIESVLENVEQVRGERFAKILTLALNYEALCKVVANTVKGPAMPMLIRMLGDTLNATLDLLEVSDADRKELVDLVDTIDSQAGTLARRAHREGVDDADR